MWLFIYRVKYPFFAADIRCIEQAAPFAFFDALRATNNTKYGSKASFDTLHPPFPASKFVYRAYKKRS